MRYTEARLSKITEDGLLKNIKKKNVDFIPNYDETEEEPVTLPAIFPKPYYVIQIQVLVLQWLVIGCLIT